MTITQTDAHGNTHEFYRHPRTRDLVKLGTATPVGIQPTEFLRREQMLRKAHPHFFATLSPGTWQAVHVRQHIMGHHHTEKDDRLQASVMCYACSHGLRFPWERLE